MKLRPVAESLAAGAAIALLTTACAPPEEDNPGLPYTSECEGTRAIEASHFIIAAASGAPLDPAEKTKAFNEALQRLRANPKLASVVLYVTVVHEDTNDRAAISQATTFATNLANELKGMAGEDANRVDSGGSIPTSTAVGRDEMDKSALVGVGPTQMEASLAVTECVPVPATPLASIPTQ